MNLLQTAWTRKRRYADMVMYWSGAAWAFERVTHPTGAVILMYHSVAGDDVAQFIDPPNHLSHTEFERQMAFLSNHRKVVSLTDLMAKLNAGEVPSSGTVCITFDDGYLDNLTVAAPILEKYQLPATLYLPTAYIDRGETHWSDTLHQIFLFRSSDQLSIPSMGVSADLADATQRMEAYRKLHLPLLTSMYADRQRLLDELCEQLHPKRKSPRLTMNWDDVRILAERFPLFAIGGHSQDHVDLSVFGGQYAYDEIECCRRKIKHELGTEPQHFSFPYARWNMETRSLVKQCGWKSAVGDGDGVRVGLKTDRFVLPRLETPISMTDLKFKTSGAYPSIYGRFGI